MWEILGIVGPFVIMVLLVGLLVTRSKGDNYMLKGRDDHEDK